MSFYQFGPKENYLTETHAFWFDGFDHNQIAEIIQTGNSKTLKKATIGGFEEEDDYTKFRNSFVSWLSHEDLPWLYDKLAFICNSLNSQFFDFELFGFHEDLQFTYYNGNTNDHYSWHVDNGFYGKPARKLSFVLQLSDPSEYEGGELQLQVGSEPISIERKKGMVTVFPSYTLHRVTPVTEGDRYSLVGWITGPRFR